MYIPSSPFFCAMDCSISYLTQGRFAHPSWSFLEFLKRILVEKAGQAAAI